MRGALKVEPTSLEALKGVLSTIAAIREASLPMELQYTDLEERFRWAPCRSCLVRREDDDFKERRKTVCILMVWRHGTWCC